MDDLNLVLKRLETSQCIDTLNLSNRQLRELPLFIQKLTHLKYLYLDNNHLIFVPEIGNFSQLEEISIENNQLTLIPESFASLKNLRCLNLSKNHLKCISSSLFVSLVNLTALWMNDCELMYLPKEIGNLKMLEKLGLKCNCLQDLPEEIGSLARLQWINLEKNEIYILPSQFKNLRNVYYINLNKNKLEAIPNELIELKNLCILLLSDNLIKSIKDDVIMGLSNLDKVDLRNNSLQTDIQIQLDSIKSFILKNKD